MLQVFTFVRRWKNELRKAAEMALEALEDIFGKEKGMSEQSMHFAKHLQSQKTHASLNYAHSWQNLP
jgi:hypothetical protein